MSDDQEKPGSDLGKGVVSDHFASEARRLGEVIASNDRIATAIFGIVVLAAVALDAFDRGELLGALILFAGLIFYSMLSAKTVARERLALERERRRLLAARPATQLTLPGVDSPRRRDHNKGTR